VSTGLRSNYLKDAPHPTSGLGSMKMWEAYIPGESLGAHSTPFLNYYLVKRVAAFISGVTRKGSIVLPSIN